METLTCKHCGLTDQYHTVPAGPHLKAICNGCGQYIKFVSQNKPPFEDNDLMPFGKHKGKAMANVPADYLLWLNDQSKVHPMVKGYIMNRIDLLRRVVNESR